MLIFSRSLGITRTYLQRPSRIALLNILNKINGMNCIISVTELVNKFLKKHFELANHIYIYIFFLVELIDKSPVILTVSRVQTKMQRSSSISIGTPTLLTQRSSITAPLPVDVIVTQCSITSYSFHTN